MGASGVFLVTGKTHVCKTFPLPCDFLPPSIKNKFFDTCHHRTKRTRIMKIRHIKTFGFERIRILLYVIALDSKTSLHQNFCLS